MAYYISSGQSRNGIILYNNYMYISSGGIAYNTMVNSDGRMYISSGGVANRTTVNSYGGMYISSGGVAYRTTVNSYGGMYISSGGVANSTTVNSGGSMDIWSGGTADNTTVNSDGSMDIFSGGVANNTTVNSGGSMDIFFGGVANNTTVNSGVHMYIHSGGVANRTTVKNWGRMYISSGGVANSTTVNSGGDMYIYSGGTALEIKENGGYVNVADGANVTFASNTINGITITDWMTVHKNTIANSTTVIRGSMVIFSGGIANSTTVNSDGYMSISSGGTALEIKENGGYVSVGDGANVTFASNTISGLTLSYTSMTVHKNTIANSTTVTRGNMVISSGGVANSTTVNSSGHMYISSGGTATDITAVDGAILYITVASNTYIQGTYNGSAFEMKDAYISGYTVNPYGYMYISSGGVVNSTTVNSGGDMYIYSGGVANNTTVDNWSLMYISSGGTALEIKENGGYVNVADGANVTFASNTINGLTISNRAMTVHKNTIANSTTVNSYCGMYIYSGGVANSTTVNDYGNMYISSGGTANRTTVNDGGDMYIDSGGVANNTTVDNWGLMYISSGGVANDTTVNSGGWMYISSGGVANDTTVNSGGWMYISSGGTALEIKENGGYVYVAARANVTFASNTINGLTISNRSMTVHKNTIANRTTVNSSGYMYIFSGGVANNTTVNSSGHMYISSGGTANSTTVNSYGYMYIYSGGVANNTTISGYSATMRISSGGVANSTTVNYGDMYIFSGGIANNTTVNDNEAMYISSGGTASIVFNPWQGTIYSSAGAMVTYLERDKNIYYGGNRSGLVSKWDNISDFEITSGNSMLIYSGGVANSTTVNAWWGEMYILSGGVANSTTISGYSATMRISSGGIANSTTVNDGSMYIYSGGTANNTMINRYGSMSIRSGGVANNTTVNNGRMFISSGGKHTGTLQIANGAIVSAYEGSIIDFTVADRTANDGYLINNLSLIKGTPTYTITVSAEQSDGTYKLAQGAEAFTGSITIGDGTTSYGSITVNGAILHYNGVGYQLTQQNGNLQLSIRDLIPPAAPTYTVSNTALTNQNVTVSATFSSDSVVKQFSLNGKDWQTYTDSIVFTENGTVSFRSQDAAGNFSEVVSYQVSNIDKVAPTLDITANKTTPTNKNVILTATVSDGTVEYFANGKWNTGNSLTVSENGTYQFRVTDAAGNSVTDSIVVFNIDKVAPTLDITADKTAPTNQNVILTATVSDGTVEYFANGKWNVGNILIVTKNGTYQFRVTDAAGNSVTDSIVVNNIDKVAPTLEVSGNATAWTNQDVILTANVSDGVVEYFDGENWVAGSTLTATENGTYQFKVTDAVGNVTTEEVVVDKIDKVAPTLEVSGNATEWTNKDIVLSANVSDGVVEYFDGENWITGSTLTVSKNGTYQFRVTDEAGNVTTEEVVVDKIDKVAPTLEVTGNATKWTNEDVILTANVSDGTVEYFANGKWTEGNTLTVSKNGTYKFRVIDKAGNVTEKSVVVDKIYKNVPEISDYIFIKDNYSAKINGKKQDGVSLSFGWNAFDKIPKKFDFTDKTVIIVNSKSVFASEIDIDGLNTLYGNVMIPTEKTGSYKLTLASKNQVDFIYADNSHMSFELFATVNVKDGASVGTVSGGKLTVSETEKSSVKKDVVTENYSYSKTVAASGKVNISNSSAANISGYATVTLDNGTAETLSNADTKISYQRKYVDGIADTITETETYSANGTATLKNGSEVDNISGFKTVKFTDSFAANIELGDSYTEKFTLKKGVKNTVVKETFTGTVTLENSKIGSVCGMNKVTASKGFNFIESYEGSNGNDTLTISKNAVLTLGSADFVEGTKDKLVNNGTLILTAEINRGYISGKGEIAACDEVLQSMKYTYGILNLGATADGFRTTKYELADNTAKKAVKWDLKSDYTGWLSDKSDCIDTVDFVKFKTGKSRQTLEISGFAAGDTFKLNDKTYTFDENGTYSIMLYSSTNYVLELEINEDDKSMSYTLAVG